MKNLLRKLSQFSLPLSALFLLLTGCDSIERSGENVIPEPDIHGGQAISMPEYPEEPVFKTDEERWEANRAKRRNIPESFGAYEKFALETASGLFADSDQNMIYSPLSLYYALAMAAEGASGATREEMLVLLGYADMKALAEDVKMYFESVYHVPNEENNKVTEWGQYASESRYTLSIANSLWADDGIMLKKDFLDRASDFYYSEIHQGDLQSDETLKAMSEWVQKKTNGLLAPTEEKSSADTVLKLLNTVYFYDEWLDRFDKEKTEADTFFCADGTDVTVDFMNRIMGSHGFRKGENFTSSSLSLKNGSVDVYLPDDGTDIHDLIDTPEKIDALLNRSGDQMMGQVTWQIPKFTYGSSLSLVDILKELGVEKAFAQDADFSNMTDQSPMFISSVKQDAHIGIDENGVEAAAFTEISWVGAAMPQGKAEMILNRPFFYVIRNNGNIVFMGICENPEI